MNILIPIAQQFLPISSPLWWAEITIPGALTKSLANTDHAFDFSIAVISGTPLLLTGESKISGGGHDFPFDFPTKIYENDNEWFDISAGFTTPGDWTATSIEIYFKAWVAEGYPCMVSFKNFKLRVTPSIKPQYLPIMGIG
jgi:hypothetical protein